MSVTTTPTPKTAGLRPPPAPFRARWEDAIKASDLPPEARLIALVLGSYVSPTAGGSRASVFVSMTTLMTATGYRDVYGRLALRYLTLAGWIVRHPPRTGTAASTPATTELIVPGPSPTE